jgi:anti-anti-sigma regulatory factor
MLRIDLGSVGEAEVVLTLAGAIAEEGVGLLGEAIRAWWRPGRQLVLDLAQVEFVDPAGVGLLEIWSGQGLLLRGASVYVGFLLQNRGLEPEPGPEPEPSV